jgi:Tol biopolymer transport system component
MTARSVVLTVVLAGATVVAGLPGTAAAAADGGRLRLVSVSSQGTRGDGSAGQARMSADGRYVVFASGSTNLVPGDEGHDGDIFLRDRRMGRTTRITLSRDGAETDGHSSYPTITPDGRYIAYLSDASNLVPGDTNGQDDVFVLDRRTGRTSRVSVSTAGAQADFRSVLRPAITPDGRYVAFLSWATDLVAGDTNDAIDVFVRDRRTRTTTRESVSPTGAQADGHSGWEPALSADGRFLAFSSDATNLVPGDTNGTDDVFVRDRRTGRTSRISVSTAGAQARSYSFQTTMTADGRYVAFTSNAPNLAAGDTNRVNDVFVRDRWAGTTTRVSLSSAAGQGNGHSADPVFGAAGRYLVFASAATDLVPGADRNGAYDVFLRDLRTGLTRRISVGANDESYDAVVSANGRQVLFTSQATNLVPGEPRPGDDVYLWSR